MQKLDFLRNKLKRSSIVVIGIGIITLLAVAFLLIKSVNPDRFMIIQDINRPSSAYTGHSVI